MRFVMFHFRIFLHEFAMLLQFRHRAKNYFVEKLSIVFHEKVKDRPLQRRMDAVVDLAIGAQVCSGGLLTALQKAIAKVNPPLGLKEGAYQWKIKMMDALILQYVKAKHAYLV